MKNKYIHLLCLILLSLGSVAQLKQFDLKQSNCQLFNGNLYVFGLTASSIKSELKVYRLNTELEIKDSISFSVSKNNSDAFLRLFSDTLHRCLNVYLQQSANKVVHIFRFNDTLGLIANLPAVDIARLNNSTLFDADVIYHDEEVYSVKNIKDSTGNQFYINKFKLKLKDENFDYEMKWQFPFERKNVEHAHLFYINNKHVFVFVNVSEGLKKGQWILMLNARNGQLVKASKINSKGETNTYLYGNCFFDTGNQTLHLAGQQFSGAQFDLEKNVLKTEDLPHCSIYHLELDSLGDFHNKQTFTIPIISINSGAKKVSSSFLLNLNTLKKSPDGKLQTETDVFKSSGSSKCFYYVNTLPIIFSPAESGYILEKCTVTTNKLIEDYYFVKDRLDLNGKQCADSLSQFMTLFYKGPAFPVKSGFKRDSDNNSMFLLSKHSLTKNNVNFSVLSPVKKVFQVTNLEDLVESKFPGMLQLSNDHFVIFHQIEDQKFQIKKYTW